MKTRVINLTAHEARAFQRGASVIVRECKDQPVKKGRFWWLYGASWNDGIDQVTVAPCHTLSARNPFGQPGDLLIGREAFRACFPTGDDGNQGDYWHVRYKCDGIEVVTNVGWDGDLEPEDCDLHAEPTWWRSAAVMPQWAARVRRIVSAVSLKRCQELTEGEIEAMKYSGEKHYLGHGDFEEVSPSEQFAKANSYLWGSNKFVWVTSVKEAT